mmetsp:Transcript_56516/g.122866  ORF Transcript_56516/g.122866 Transcript_56516/m.122866 type:complete len:82 (+) Transcript_56516:774-1019(+)
MYWRHTRQARIDSAQPCLHSAQATLDEQEQTGIMEMVRQWSTAWLVRRGLAALAEWTTSKAIMIRQAFDDQRKVFGPRLVN